MLFRWYTKNAAGFCKNPLFLSLESGNYVHTFCLNIFFFFEVTQSYSSYYLTTCSNMNGLTKKNKLVPADTDIRWVTDFPILRFSCSYFRVHINDIIANSNESFGVFFLAFHLDIFYMAKIIRENCHFSL